MRKHKGLAPVAQACRSSVGAGQRNPYEGPVGWPQESKGSVQASQLESGDQPNPRVIEGSWGWGGEARRRTARRRAREVAWWKRE